MKGVLLQIVAGILGIFLAVSFLSGVSLRIIPGKSSFLGIPLTSNWQILILAGGTLGMFNFFLRPVLRFIAFPLRVLTLGLFGFVINMFLVWLVAVLFQEFEIQGLLPLFGTTIIVWLTSTVFGWLS
ncbi:MAG TPA: phage holin family protein [bacterium]|nr:phage holin family protein [bacterium]